MTGIRKLLDYYDSVANMPTVKVAIPDKPTEKARAFVLPVPGPDPLIALARRDTFASRVFFARLHDAQRRARLFDDVEAIGRVESEMAR